MEALVSRLLKQFEDGTMSRRQLIQSLAVAALAGPAATSVRAQTGNRFRTVRLDHLSYQVPDYRRTRDFYADLMGMSVAADNGKDYCQLQFGEAHKAGARDRSFLSVRTARPQTGQAVGPSPGARIDHVAFTIESWETDKVRAELERRKLRPRLEPGGTGDTPNYVSFHVEDPNGFDLQISGIARPGDPLYKRP
jgi:catechol 2,3-dioxygenase-like lactoylglutathione lyase family enzyme